MKSLEEQLAVMQAALEGKEIEILKEEQGSEWCEVRNPSFDWAHCDYRVKPDGPVYVPYKTGKELIDAIMYHRDWVLLKDRNGNERGDCYYQLSGFCTFDHSVGIVTADELSSVTFEELFLDYVWASDGLPCGKLVDNQ